MPSDPLEMAIEGQKILTTLEITLIHRLKAQDEALKEAQLANAELETKVNQLAIHCAELERMVVDRRAPVA